MNCRALNKRQTDIISRTSLLDLCDLKTQKTRHRFFEPSHNVIMCVSKNGDKKQNGRKLFKKQQYFTLMQLSERVSNLSYLLKIEGKSQPPINKFFRLDKICAEQFRGSVLSLEIPSLLLGTNPQLCHCHLN